VSINVTHTTNYTGTFVRKSSKDFITEFEGEDTQVEETSPEMCVEVLHKEYYKVVLNKIVEKWEKGKGREVYYRRLQEEFFEVEKERMLKSEKQLSEALEVLMRCWYITREEIKAIEPRKKVYYSPTPLGIIMNYILIVLKSLEGVKEKTIIYLPLIKVLSHFFFLTLSLYLYVVSKEPVTSFTIRLKSGRMVRANIHHGFVAVFRAISLLVGRSIEEFGGLVDTAIKAPYIDRDVFIHENLEEMKRIMKDFIKDLQKVRRLYEAYMPTADIRVYQLLENLPRSLAKALKVHIEGNTTSQATSRMS
jgi:DNA-binding HxlR family transcriptional regulator